MQRVFPSKNSKCCPSSRRHEITVKTPLPPKTMHTRRKIWHFCHLIFAQKCGQKFTGKTDVAKLFVFLKIVQVFLIDKFIENLFKKEERPLRLKTIRHLNFWVLSRSWFDIKTGYNFHNFARKNRVIFAMILFLKRLFFLVGKIVEKSYRR